MVHFREQRGSLQDSLKTIATVGSRAALVAHLRKVLAPLPVNGKSVSVRFYTYDRRTGWNTFLVTVNGDAVGFTDGRV